MTNINGRISDRIELAVICAEDGAYHTATRILRELASEVEAFANARDIALGLRPTK